MTPDFRAERRWLVWRVRGDRKVPCDDQGNNLVGWQEPKSWMTHDEARAVLKRLPFAASSADGRINAGLGRVDGDGWAHVDLDYCRDDDPFLTLLREAGGYVERSPSRKGWHCVGRGPSSLEVTYKGGNGPVLNELGRFLTVTGIDASGDPHADISSALEAVRGNFVKRRGETPAPATPAAAVALDDKDDVRPLPMPQVVAPGSQNTELFREGCRLAREGKSEDEIAGILLVLKDRCPPEPGKAPWNEDSIRRVARSAARYAPSDDPYPSTESGDAEYFAQIHADLCRYDHRQGRWLVWDGVCWEPDPVRRLTEYALASARARQASGMRIGDPDMRKARIKWALGAESAFRLGHMLDLATSKPGIASKGDEWDRDPWLLGVPNGVVDLRTGQLKPGRPADLITMQTSVPYDPTAKSELWERTVDAIFKDDPEIVPYLKRALGYSLTGDCRHEVFFLLTGETGRNGKGTIMNTVSRILGDYSSDLAFHSLEVSKHGGDGGPTPDLAKLAHKRYVTASETSGGRFNEAKIKKVTGRDPITCRFLHQNEFTYVPEFKLWLSVNQLPKVHDDCEAFWSRPHRVPFNQCFLGREDLQLKDKLMEEASGILTWLVQGSLQWQAAGLLPSPAVTQAIRDYRRSQEPLAEFLTEETEEDPFSEVPAGELFGKYKAWADEKRLFRRVGRNQFHNELRKRFRLEESTSTHALVVKGLRLASQGGAPSQGEILE